MSTKQDTRKQKAAEKREQVTKVHAATVERIQADTDYAAEFAKFAAKFPGYSVKNQELIFAQMDSATVCAGFNKWKAEGRMVRKGEKGIKIFAPTTRKVKDAEGKPEKDKDGEDKKEHRFVMVTVFDISQTEPAAE